MDEQTPLTASNPLLHRPAIDERDAELIRLRDRLAFYESFDDLIQENVSRSGDLLRQAMERRETAARESADARAAVERERTERRAEYRRLFSGMLDELVVLQGQAERLARRLADALDEIETDLPPSPPPRDAEGGEFSSAPAFVDAATLTHPSVATHAVGRPAGRTADSDRGGSGVSWDAASAAPATTSATADDRVVLNGAVPAPNSSSPPADGIPADVQPFTPEDAEAVVRCPAADHPTALGPALDRGATADVTTAERSLVVLVHGVPRATAALSLKRHLEGLAHVGQVEPREFAEGILRLQVTAHRPLGLDDFRGWPDGAGLEPVHLRDDLVEVRLPR